MKVNIIVHLFSQIGQKFYNIKAKKQKYNYKFRLILVFSNKAGKVSWKELNLLKFKCTMQKWQK